MIINFIFFCLMLMGSQGRGKKKICSDCHIKRFEGQNSVCVYVGSRLAFLKFRITGCRDEPTLRPKTAVLGRKGLAGPWEPAFQEVPPFLQPSLLRGRS